MPIILEDEDNFTETKPRCLIEIFLAVFSSEAQTHGQDRLEPKSTVPSC